MPATLEKPAETAPAPEPEQLPDASVLEDKTPDWCRMSSGSTAFILGLGLTLVVLFANRPLMQTDLWDHINYGRHTAESGAIPSTEPLLKLAEGMPMVPTAWATQLGMWKIQSTKRLGLPALQFAHGSLVIFAMAAIGIAVLRRTRSMAFAIVAYFVLLVVNWQQFLVIRPQAVGVTFYCILLASLTLDAPRRSWSWFTLPLMFVCWVNCHGSFSVGLAVLALYSAGQFFDGWILSRSLRLAVRNRSMWRTILLLQVCAAASLINPTGIGVFHEVLRVGNHPNIASMFEWDPINLRMKHGQVLAVVFGVLIYISRFSPRRIRATEVIVLVATAGMALWSARMVNWFAPVIALVIGIHGAAVWRVMRKRPRPTEPSARGGLWTLMNLGLCWIFFGFTAFGTQTIHGKTPDIRRSLAHETPIEVTEYLNRTNQATSQVAFVPAEWAGYMMNSGRDWLRPMVNLHVHVIPEEVWADYVRLAEGVADWDGLVDRYGIDLLVTDKSRHKYLIRQLRSSDQFRKSYEDHQAIVFVRRGSRPDSFAGTTSSE